MKKSSLICLILICLHSCTYLIPFETAANTLVTTYCKAPEEVRLVNRMNLSRILYPNTIQITCNSL